MSVPSFFLLLWKHILIFKILKGNLLKVQSLPKIGSDPENCSANWHVQLSIKEDFSSIKWEVVTGEKPNRNSGAAFLVKKNQN